MNGLAIRIGECSQLERNIRNSPLREISESSKRGRTHCVYGYIAIFGIILLESAGIPFPGETILIGAAIYAGSHDTLDIRLIIAAAAGAAILGGNIGYWLCRTLGRKALLRWGYLIGLDQRKLDLSSCQNAELLQFVRGSSFSRKCVTNRGEWRIELTHRRASSLVGFVRGMRSRPSSPPISLVGGTSGERCTGEKLCDEGGWSQLDVRWGLSQTDTDRRPSWVCSALKSGHSITGHYANVCFAPEAAVPRKLQFDFKPTSFRFWRA